MKRIFVTMKKALQMAGDKADDILDEVVCSTFYEDEFINKNTTGWSDIPDEFLDEIENELFEPLKKDFVRWVSNKEVELDEDDLDYQLECHLIYDLEEFLNSERGDIYIDKAQKMIDDWKKENYGEDLEESRKPRKSFNMLRESFLGNRKRGGFDASKIMRNLKDGRYDDERVIAACVSALEKGQKSSLAQKLVKQLSSDGILAKVYRKSGEFGTKQ